MDNIYICPRCNGELEVHFKDYRGDPMPGLSAYNQPDCTCVITCRHCDWNSSGCFQESDFDAVFFPDAVKRYMYQRFCDRVMKRPMRRYKPVDDTVTAVQWTGRNYEEMQMLLVSPSRTNDILQILSHGEYVIRHVDGTFSILPEKDFKEKYEEVLK